MIQILSVKSVRKVDKLVSRLEGALLRRSRFLGWRPVWVNWTKQTFQICYLYVSIAMHFQVVLERGVLNYYSSRADSTGLKNRNKRLDYKYLDNARVTLLPTTTSFVVHFSDGSVNRLGCVSNDEKALVERQVNKCQSND